MTGWHHGALTPFDLESTGTDRREDRIVTGYVATVAPAPPGWAPGVRRDVAIGARVLVDPGVPIPAEASAVHGITDEVARTKGCDPRDGVNSVAEALARSLLARIPVVGFNLPYDLGLLYHECLRHGLPTLGERLGRPPAAMVGPIIDAHVLDKHVDPYVKGAGQRKLTPTAARWGVTLTNAHEADSDALAATRVAFRIAERRPEIGRMSVTALHAAQKQWRAEQAAGLQEYFRGKGGKPDAFVDPCFPFCVDDTHPSN